MPRHSGELFLNNPTAPTTEPLTEVQSKAPDFAEETWFEYQVGDTVPLLKHSYQLEKKIAAGGMGKCGWPNETMD